MNAVSPIKLKAVLLILLALSTNNVFSQSIKGTCLLLDQPVFDSIRVSRFYPVHTIQDTAYTDSLGNFQLGSVPLNQVCTLEFFKPGFLTQTLIVKQTTTNLKISIRLLSDVKPVKYISGNINGILYEDTIYVSESYLEVAPTDFLQIKAGTRMFFQPDDYFDWNGEVICSGEENKLIKMEGLFSVPGYSLNKWEGVNLGPNTISYTTMIDSYLFMDSIGGKADHLLMDDATIEMIGKNSTVENCRLMNAYNGIHANIDVDTGFVRNCVIRDCHNGIHVDNTNFNPGVTMHIENNDVANCVNGIWTAGDAFVSHNRIHDNSVGIKSASRWIEFNDIYRNRAGITVDGYDNDTIINNTFVYNDYGVEYFFYEKVSYISNIFAFNIKCGINFYGKGINRGQFNLHYNNVNFSGHYNSQYYTGVNIYGDSIDFWSNVYVDPDFYSVDTADAHFLFLNTTSSCINTADTNFIDPADGSLRDIGAHPAYIPTGINDAEKNTNIRMNVFPNPGNGTFNLSLNNRSAGVILLYNTVGSLVYQAHVPANYSKQFTLPVDLKDGIYILKYIDPDNWVSTRLILSR